MEDPMETEEQTPTPINEPKTPKTSKRKQSKINEDDDDVVVVKERNIKGILLSVRKPSYVLKRGIGRELRSLRSEHRNRLRHILRQLVRRQNWEEGCGVLSLLLKGTYKESGVRSNRNKYWATLELLERMKAAKLEHKTVQKVYDIWMKKDGDGKNKRSLKGRLDVQLEFLLFYLSRSKTDDAIQTIISLKQDRDFSKDPIANLVVGLAYCHLWYKGVSKEVCVRLNDDDESHESSTSIQSGMSVSQDMMSVHYSNGQEGADVEVQKPDSNTSVGNYKREVKKEKPEYDDIHRTFDELHMNSNESDESGNASRFPHTGKKTYGSIVNAQDLEDLLMPIRFPKTKSFEDFISLQNIIKNDHYKASVDHLKNALHSTPPAFEALLPLIQMLLYGDQVKEAIEEIESAVQISHAALPFRLKASLLEHFSKEDASKLCSCFEDTLSKDPTCNHSLSKLINLHHVGVYSRESLVEMIALHLDATYASCDIWKEFASCFIELSGCDEDRMSSCVNGDDESRYINSSKNIPDMFQVNIAKKNWKLRCRWWLTRHFSQTMLASEVNSGNLELVAYKAASACHLYGPESVYVVSACRYLRKENCEELLILKEHMENAVGFAQHNTRCWASSYV